MAEKYLRESSVGRPHRVLQAHLWLYFVSDSYSIGVVGQNLPLT